MNQKNYTIQTLQGKLDGTLNITGKETDTIAILSHGRTGYKDHQVFIALTKTLQDLNIVSYRFSFGGCGDSYQRDLSIAKDAEDLKEVREHFKKQYKKIILIGLSQGSQVSLRQDHADPSIFQTILLAPSLYPHDIKLLKRQREELETTGRTTTTKENGTFSFTQEFLDEYLHLDSTTHNIKKPILLIHGTADDLISIEKTKQAMHMFPEGSVLVEIEGAPHTFVNHVKEVCEAVERWLIHKL
jgi:hypothetical protein